MRLQPGETRLDGQWEIRSGRPVKDSTCERIEALIQNLERVGVDESGWDTLYRDPLDGRYWELTYLHSEMHGGGPPSLLQVPNELLASKYRINLGLRG